MDEAFLTYSALDSACMLEIEEAIWPDLDPDFRKTYDMTIALGPVLTFMQTRGVRVSHDNLELTKIEVLKHAAEKQVKLNELVGRELNVNSPKACAAYFYVEKGITPYKGKTGSITCDDLAMQRIARGTAARKGLYEATLVQEIRGLQKLYGTYLNMSFDSDGRMRGSYNPRGTAFGRLSSSKTIFNTGMNFQNLPQEFKRFLVADPGYFLLEIDKRQAEWVVVAFASGDANMIKAIEDGVDVHIHTARTMFDCSDEIIKLDSRTVGHSTNPTDIYEARISEPLLQEYVSMFPKNMSARQCGKKCMPGDTEVLTPNGWVQLAALAGSAHIAQWDNDRITFVIPSEVSVYDGVDNLLTFTANHVSQYTTPEHRILTRNDRTKKHEVVLAKDFQKKTHYHIPVAGNYTDGDGPLALTPDEARLLVAIQADGSVDTYNNLILRVDKERKVSRAKRLLDRMDMRYTVTSRGFFIHSTNNAATRIALLLGKKKLFGSYLLDSSHETLRAFLWETIHWDGYAPKYQYFTTVKENAEWVQTIAHIVGCRATVKERPNNGFGTLPIHWVKISDRNTTSLISVETGSVPHKGKVYCPTVPSGFFLVRHKGKISVTGNSNHGLNYDEGYRNFALLNNMLEADAKKICDLYHKSYPGIRIWYEEVQRQLGDNRTLRNCFGRAVRFLGRWDPSLFKSAYSMIPQSTVVDGLNQGMVKIYADKWITQEQDVDVLAQVHDSILMQAPVDILTRPADFNEFLRRIHEYTSPMMEYRGREFKIASDIKVGLNWGSHSGDNPGGMDDAVTFEDVQKVVAAGSGNGSGTCELA